MSNRILAFSLNLPLHISSANNLRFETSIVIWIVRELPSTATVFIELFPLQKAMFFSALFLDNPVF